LSGSNGTDGEPVRDIIFVRLSFLLGYGLETDNVCNVLPRGHRDLKECQASQE